PLALGGQAAGELCGDAVIVSAAVMAVRFLWVFPTVRLPRLLSRRLREREPAPPWGQSIVVAWTGMRGAVSLAAALAIPLAVRDRDLIIFLTYAVIEIG